MSYTLGTREHDRFRERCVGPRDDDAGREHSMNRTFNCLMARLGLSVIVVALGASPVIGQSGAKNGEWPTYGGDLGHTRYSPLDQITADNFSKLEIAWRFKTDNLGPRPEYSSRGHR